MKDIKFSEKQIERFWSSVDCKGIDDCWEWTGYKSPSGYGRITINYQNYRTNRLAWMVTNGPIPDGLFACHKCDTPACVNPNHLFLGDARINFVDCINKGRAVFQTGDNHWTRRMPEKMQWGDKHWTNRMPEKKYTKERHWTTLNPERIARGENHIQAKLNDDMVRTIRTWYASGRTQQSIADELGIGQMTVSKVIRRVTWAHVE